jgi:rhomboid family GlyGly-CTERM serine protease
MFQFKTLPIQATHSRAPLMLLMIALSCFIFNSQISDYFIYNRALIDDSQYWRLITGHFFHTNYAHFLLNTLAIVLLWALHGQFYSTKQYCVLFLLSSLIVSFGIFIFTPQMNEYVGLSGVLHAFFIWGALKDIEHKEKTGYLLLLGVVIKVGHEQIYGASEEVAALINANVAIDAHLWGSISGLLFYVFSVNQSKLFQNNIHR